MFKCRVHEINYRKTLFKTKKTQDKLLLKITTAE